MIQIDEQALQKRISRQVAYTMQLIEESYDDVIDEDGLKAKLKNSLWLLQDDLLNLDLQK